MVGNVGHIQVLQHKVERLPLVSAKNFGLPRRILRVDEQPLVHAGANYGSSNFAAHEASTRHSQVQQLGCVPVPEDRILHCGEDWVLPGEAFLSRNWPDSELQLKGIWVRDTMFVVARERPEQRRLESDSGPAKEERGVRWRQAMVEVAVAMLVDNLHEAWAIRTAVAFLTDSGSVEQWPRPVEGDSRPGRQAAAESIWREGVDDERFAGAFLGMTASFGFVTCISVVFSWRCGLALG